MKVVVAVDGSDLSAEAARFALEKFRGEDRHFLLLSCAETQESEILGADEGGR